MSRPVKDRIIYRVPGGYVLGLYTYGYFVAQEYRTKSGAIALLDQNYFGYGNLASALKFMIERIGEVRGYKTLHGAVQTLSRLHDELVSALQKGELKP